MRMYFTKLRRIIVIAAAIITTLFTLGSPAYAETTTTTAGSAHATRSTASTAALNSAITWKNCSGEYGKTTSVVIAIYFYARPSVQYYCYSGRGTWKFNTTSSPYITENFCAGNNKGTFTYLQKGKLHSFSFGPGKDVNFHHSVTTYAKTLTITGWSGKDTCGT